MVAVVIAVVIGATAVAAFVVEGVVGIWGVAAVSCFGDYDRGGWPPHFVYTRSELARDKEILEDGLYRLS